MRVNKVGVVGLGAGEMSSEEEGVVSLQDVLEENRQLEETANAVLGASDDSSCTYPKVGRLASRLRPLSLSLSLSLPRATWTDRRCTPAPPAPEMPGPLPRPPRLGERRTSWPGCVSRAVSTATRDMTSTNSTPRGRLAQHEHYNTAPRDPLSPAWQTVQV